MSENTLQYITWNQYDIQGYAADKYHHVVFSDWI